MLVGISVPYTCFNACDPTRERHEARNGSKSANWSRLAVSGCFVALEKRLHLPRVRPASSSDMIHVLKHCVRTAAKTMGQITAAMSTTLRITDHFEETACPWLNEIRIPTVRYAAGRMILQLARR